MKSNRAESGRLAAKRNRRCRLCPRPSPATFRSTRGVDADACFRWSAALGPRSAVPSPPGEGVSFWEQGGVQWPNPGVLGTEEPPSPRTVSTGDEASDVRPSTSNGGRCFCRRGRGRGSGKLATSRSRLIVPESRVSKWAVMCLHWMGGNAAMFWSINDLAGKVFVGALIGVACFFGGRQLLRYDG